MAGRLHAPRPHLPGFSGGLAAPREEPSLVAGIDEAGRGCLAGPVVACAVILPPRFDLPGLTDSKLLGARQREKLAPAIRACAVAWGLGVVWSRRIERVNILEATLEAMARAACTLRTPPALLLIDGNRTIPEDLLLTMWRKAHHGAAPRQRALVGGDRSEPAISAASVLAKTFRDRLMAALGRRWPGYGLERHMGYGTREHLEALRRLGPCPLHRRTFRGVLPADERPAALGAAAWGALC
ncbi:MULTISPECIES: ribonuclease HII [unclassified Desulfovibrio]|uniref:ribonuclease HII n=1 Tax=unclassified Desulfovibrio TaxID=2593640 RepID=UPI0013EB8224|nr:MULTISPECIES: ribonuclease HII [unclassified Desulfovibrio]